MHFMYKIGNSSYNFGIILRAHIIFQKFRILAVAFHFQPVKCLAQLNLALSQAFLSEPHLMQYLFIYFCTLNRLKALQTVGARTNVSVNGGLQNVWVRDGSDRGRDVVTVFRGSWYKWVKSKFLSDKELHQLSGNDQCEMTRTMADVVILP